MASSKFDDLLVHLGTGKWNWFYIAMICWYCFFLPGQILNIIFAAPAVSYTCLIPKEDEDRAPQQNLIDSCTYLVNSTDPEEEPLKQTCTDWKFDNSTFTKTLTSEYQLVCDRSILTATYHGMFMLGNVFGPAIAGVFSDKYGRKIVTITGGVIFGVTAAILPFVPNMTAILTLRFIMGFFNLPTGYIWALEVCEPGKRSYVGILTALPWALGTMVFGGVAYFVRDWHWLQTIMAFPLLALLPAMWLMDESPRWLIVKGQHQKALEIINKAARWNNVKLPPQSELLGILKDIQNESVLTPTEEEDSENSLTESQRMMTKSQDTKQNTAPWYSLKCGVCSTVNIRTVTLVMALNFCVSSLVYYGLTLSAKDFGVNMFVYIIIGGLAEVPAYTVPAFVIAKFGRRIPTAICYVACGIALLVLIVTPEDVRWLIMLLAMVGKLGISSAGQMVFLYVTELYPTEYRPQGMGLAILAQRAGSITAPFMVLILGAITWWTPSVVMGILSLLAGLATMMLPETLGAILPDTLGDLDELFANKKKINKGLATVETVPMQA